MSEDDSNKEPFELLYAQCSNAAYKKGKGCFYQWVPRTPRPKKCPKCGAKLTWKRD